MAFVMSKDFGHVVEVLNNINFGAELDLAPLESDLGRKTPNSFVGSFSKEFDLSISSNNQQAGGDVSSFLTLSPMSSPSDDSSSSIKETTRISV